VGARLRARSRARASIERTGDSLLEGARAWHAVAPGDTIAVVFGAARRRSPPAALTRPKPPRPTASGARAAPPRSARCLLARRGDAHADHIPGRLANKPFRFTVQAFRGRDGSRREHRRGQERARPR
jgi:hypothetical protein